MSSVGLLFVSSWSNWNHLLSCLLCSRSCIQLLPVHVTCSSVSSQSWLSQLQNAFQPCTDGLDSRYTTLSFFIRATKNARLPNNCWASIRHFPLAGHSSVCSILLCLSEAWLAHLTPADGEPFLAGLEP